MMHLTMMMILCLIVLTFVLDLTATSADVCPVQSQWSLRANSLCNSTQRYFCLFDENKSGYTEFCGSAPDFERPGFKQVVIGGRTRKPCSDDRFQPFMFWTNGSSRCEYRRSECNEEGQVIFDNGSVRRDRRCRCDYTRNYDFVSRPINRCYCVPSEEDCSCYIRSCPSGYILTQDYQCVSTINWKPNFQCQPIIPEFHYDNEANSNITSILETRNADSDYVFMMLMLFVVITIVYAITAGSWLILKKDKPAKEHSIDHDPHEESAYISEYKQHTKQLEGKKMSKWKEQHMNFIETNASKVIFKTVNTQKCVAMVGPPGSGKSDLAYYIAWRMEKEKEYTICICQNTSDIISYRSHNAKVLFLFDDVIGRYSVSEDAMESWEQYNQDISHLLSIYTDMKIVLTCRLYIYKLTRFDCMKNISPSYCELLSDQLKLDLGERRDILKSYNNDVTIDDDVMLMYDCFPLMCSTLYDDKQKDILDFFKRPHNVLQLEIDHLKKKSEIVYFSLALLVILNNNVEKSMLDIDNEMNNRLVYDLFDELEFKQLPSKKRLRSCMHALRDTYVKETETSFTFLHEPLFEVISYCIGENIINCIIKYADSSFIKNRIQLLSLKQPHKLTIMLKDNDHLQKQPHDKLPIMLKDNDNLQKLYFDRLLTDIKKGLNWDVFSNRQIQFSEHRRLFKDYLDKQLKPEYLTSGPDGSTALHVISDQGFDDFVLMFINLDNTMINKKNSSGKTALHLASSKGYTKLAQTLITNIYKAADPALLDNDNLTPLHEACKNGHVDTVKYLLDRTHNQKKTWVSKNKVHILHTVCENGHTNMVKEILRYKVDVNIKTEEGFTSLYLACKAGHYDTVQKLLECKAKMDSDDKTDETPLFIACRNNRETIVKLLLEKGASVNKIDQHGSTALHISCSSGFENISDTLLRKEAMINKGDSNGNTPLYNACRGGHQKVINILINHTARVNIANKSGRTPLIISCAKGNTEVVRILLVKDAAVNQCDAESSTPLYVACQRGCIEIVKVLLESNANTDICDKVGRTPLYIACKKSEQIYIEIVEHLLKNNANVNKADKNGLTPLHVSCKCNNIKAVKHLLRYNADVNQGDKDGITSLQLCEKYGCSSIADCLIKYENMQM